MTAFGVAIVVLLIGAAATLWLLFAERRPERVPPPRPLDVRELDPAGRPVAALFQRLPIELGHHLVCIEAQDRGVRVHTLSGSAWLPVRLRQAIYELSGVEGLQVHRSWWVARGEVRQVRTDEGGVRLELANGMLAPVAPARLRDLRRDGWL